MLALKYRADILHAAWKPTTVQEIYEHDEIPPSMKNQHSCSIDFRYYRARSEHDFFKSRNNIRILEIKTCLKKLKKRGNFTR